VCLIVTALTFIVHAENTYSVFSFGAALPLSSAASTPSGDKKLGLGWDAGWTFFGLPFTNSGSLLSGLSFGGQISYSRWVRDSTLSETTFLGTQGIVRYYVPPFIKPFDLFVQAGCGMFIGERGFAGPDTLNHASAPTDVVVTEGKINTGVSLNIGIDWDVIEFIPGMTIVYTKGKSSVWYSFDAAMKF
jgi:hypothetical protein